METDHGPLHSEPVSGSDIFSDGDCSDGPSFSAEEQLDGLHRSEGRVPSDPDPPWESQVSQVHSCRQDLAVSGSVFRSVHSTAGVYSHDGTCVGLPPSAGRPDASVSGRLADCGFSGGGLLGKGSGSQLVPGTGNCSKSGEINSVSISRDCLSGIQDRFADFQGFGDSLEDRRFFSNSRRISVFIGAVCKVLEGSVGPPRVSDAPCSE